jgi:hypothetical protein
MNTDLEKVFTHLLRTCIRYELPQSEVPDTVIILSDMQFDQGCSYNDDVAYQAIRKSFKVNGYTPPDLVWWNINAKGGLPILQGDVGTSMVSGFSPAIMKSFLAGEMTPIGIMQDAISDPRYSF